MINDSVSHWVGESVVQEYNKTKGNMFEVVISPVHFGRGLFVILIFIFFYTDNKKQI